MTAEITSIRPLIHQTEVATYLVAFLQSYLTDGAYFLIQTLVKKQYDVTPKELAAASGLSHNSTLSYLKLLYHLGLVEKTKIATDRVKNGYIYSVVEGALPLLRTVLKIRHMD